MMDAGLFKPPINEAEDMEGGAEEEAGEMEEEPSEGIALLFFFYSPRELDT